jgi:uncharacterized membrane protein YeiB
MLLSNSQDAVEAQPGDRTPPRRLESVDILRGLALLGMLAAHFQYYPSHHFGTLLGEAPINFAIHNLVDGRFYPLFALLFGIVRAPRDLDRSFHGIVITHSTAS